MSCVIGLLLPCYICLIELLVALLSYCLWLFVFSWFKLKKESIDLNILLLLSCQTFFVSVDVIIVVFLVGFYVILDVKVRFR